MVFRFAIFQLLGCFFLLFSFQGSFFFLAALCGFLPRRTACLYYHLVFTLSTSFFIFFIGSFCFLFCCLFWCCLSYLDGVFNLSYLLLFVNSFLLFFFGTFLKGQFLMIYSMEKKCNRCYPLLYIRISIQKVHSFFLSEIISSTNR